MSRPTTLRLELLINLCVGVGPGVVEKRPDGSGRSRGRGAQVQARPRPRAARAYQYPGTGPLLANGVVELIVRGESVYASTTNVLPLIGMELGSGAARR